MKSGPSAAQDFQMKNKAASDIALMEIVRFLLGEYASRPDAIDMRALLASIEAQLVDNLMSRPIWDTTDEAGRVYVKETASRYISGIVASIRHPSEPPATKPSVM